MFQLGVIGLGTMGANLARNAARNGATVPIFNRTAAKTDEFMKAHGNEGRFIPCTTIEEFVKALTPPRPVLLMVKAGEAVDEMIDDLLPLLEKGDILIDAGNSHYKDTARREGELKHEGLHFVGMGVSGGEEGALHGPSMMPGGDKGSLQSIAPLLATMAADDGAGGKCVAYLGPSGSGHFVKMVHNGIEYGIMQLLAETYDLLKNIGGYTNAELAETFESWNTLSQMQSFLIEITGKIFRKKDDLGDGDLIDIIKDSAGQKGTGKWTTDAAMGYGVPIPTINAAVDARILSGSAQLRKQSKVLPRHIDIHEIPPCPQQLRSIVRAALEMSTSMAYMQGLELMHHASKEEKWNLNLSEISRIWRGGCIIRSGFLRHLQAAFGDDTSVKRAAQEAILDRFETQQTDWRRAVQIGISRGIPLPAMSASLWYFDSIVRKTLPQNLIQAQRDFFGAHTYQRTDKKGVFHTHWA